MIIKVIFNFVLSVGVLISLVNFYLSFLRYPLWRTSGRAPEDFKWVSGFPVVGSAAIAVSLLLIKPPAWIIIVGLAAAILDTGGIHWLLFALIKHRND